MADHRQDHFTANDTATGLLLGSRPRHQSQRKTTATTWLVSIGTAALIVISAVTVGLGATGFGIAPEPVPALTMATPFSTKDPVSFRGSTNAPVDLGPNTLSIPSVGLKMPIVTSGSDGKQLIVPESSKAGLFTGASPIGAAKGSTMIVGHVNFSSGAAAPMSLITKVQRGAPIFVTDSTGKIFTYTADTAASYEKGNLPNQFFQSIGTPQLVLISCANLALVKGVWEFTENITVTAKPLVQGSKQ